jgi:catechol 2,3-dioxygenase-like lactoylglutathione lyase family enzyme
MPLAHVSIPASDLQKSKAFYLQALQPLGYEIYKEFDVTVGMGPKHAAPDLWLHKGPEQKDGEKAVSNVHVAFCGKSKKAVEAFYQAAL